MRIKEALGVLGAMALLALFLAVWRFGLPSGGPSSKPVIFQLSWRAQVESGGFVVAANKGYFRDCGLDVQLRQGGAGLDPAQLLVGRAVDAVLMPQSDGVLQMNRSGFPARAIFGSMQHTPASIIVHDSSPITNVAQMRGKPIMISASSRASWWNFLKLRYGFTDDQIRSFSGQRGPFINDPSAIAQDLISNGPYVIWQSAHIKVRSFLLTDLGYDPYGGVLTVSQALIDQRPEAVRCLIEGSRRGWADFVRDPRDGFAMIMKMSPEQTLGLLEYGYAQLRERHLIQTEETARLGLGVINPERWRSHARLLVESGVLPAGFDPMPAMAAGFQPGTTSKGRQP
jgi:NitT/TauT family transport system substrate-binding protein